MPFGPNAINTGYGQSQNNPTGISNEVIPQNPAQTPGNFVITGGSIDGTPIGITTPAAGKFTTIDLSTPLSVANGGTGQSSTPNNGQLLIGNGSGYSIANLTAGTGVVITNGNGSITVSAPDVGSVTSVNASGGTTGLSFSGGPVTSSGTLTLAGTLAIANGGTGATTASNALVSLGAYPASNPSSYTSNVGTVTSVALSGGTTGLTVSGSPISTSGTITIAGTLSVANGGTGSTTASDARTALGLGTIATKAAPNGTNAQLLANDGSGGFSNVTVGSGLSYSGGTLTATTSGVGTVTSVDGSGGTTGLTFTGGPVTTSGTLTVGGTLVVANGGTGATTLTGYVKGNGTSAMTATSTIPNTDISGLGTISTQAANNVAITGGSINGTTIGLTTPSTGAFTTLSATGATNLDAGTVSAPGLYLEGETGTGLYRIGANNHGYAVSGSKVLDISSTGLAVTGGISDSKGEIRLVPQNSQSAAYTLVLADAGKHILHPAADTTARTFTIPANSSVAYPVGTAITFVNQNAGGTVTIAITSDTMRLAGAGTTGSRTLAANGVATALKITSTEWIISGTGLT